MNNILAAALLCGTLSGCAGMNGDFDCNKTATDQCLTTAQANKMAAQGKSLDDLTADSATKKPAGETLPALRNTAPSVSTARPVSVAATRTSSTPLLSPRPLYTPPAVSSVVTSPSVGHIQTATVKPASDAGRVAVLRVPDATQRLWISPWVDTDDNFHQPAVVEFVRETERSDLAEREQFVVRIEPD